MNLKTMTLWRIAFMMLAAFYLASCKPSARQTAADAEPPTDSTEVTTGTLRLAIADKHLATLDNIVQARIVNPTDTTVEYGKEYHIERETADGWQEVPWSDDYGWNLVGYGVKPHSSTMQGTTAQIDFFHLAPGHYRLSKEVGGEILSNGFYID